MRGTYPPPSSLLLAICLGENEGWLLPARLEGGTWRPAVWRPAAAGDGAEPACPAGSALLWDPAVHDHLAQVDPSEGQAAEGGWGGEVPWQALPPWVAELRPREPEGERGRGRLGAPHAAL